MHNKCIHCSNLNYVFVFKGSIIEKEKFLKPKPTTKGKLLWHMRKSATKKNKIKACERLLAEYTKLKNKHVKALSTIKDHNFQNTCPLLAKHYQVPPILINFTLLSNAWKVLSHLQLFYKGEHCYPLYG